MYSRRADHRAELRSTSVCSVSVPPGRLGHAEVDDLGHGLAVVQRRPARCDGLMSRWMIPFWWACCTAWQTGTNSSSRCRGVSLRLVAVLGDRARP